MKKNVKIKKVKIKKSKTLSEFNNFILKGNVIDLAVGIIIGGAFNKIVSSLVADVLTPVLSIFTSNVSFSNLKIPLSFLKMDEIPTINIGAFFTSIIDFVIMGFIVFCLVKTLNKIRKGANELLEKIGEEEVKPPENKECPFCFSQINAKATRCPACTSVLEAGN